MSNVNRMIAVIGALVLLSCKDSIHEHQLSMTNPDATPHTAANATENPATENPASGTPSEQPSASPTPGSASPAAIPIPADRAPGQVKNYLTKTDWIGFNGKTYQLSWSSHPAPNYYKQEYLVKGEIQDKYSEMLVLEVLVGDVSPKDAASAKIREVQARKATDPVANYESSENAKTGEILLDFLMSEKTITEWNTYRYQSRKLASGQSALVLMGFSKRAYEGSAPTPADFLKSLARDRKGLTEKFGRLDTPAIDIKN